MSPRRNTPSPVSRRRHTAAALGTLLAPVAALLAACSTESPTAPEPHPASASVSATATPAAALLSLPMSLPSPFGLLATVDSLNRATLGQLTTLALTWHTQPSDQESGRALPLPLRCTTGAQYTGTQVIGPAGGVLTFGRSTLTIPRGALASATPLSASLTLSSTGVAIEFQPHGLQFAKAATLQADFAGCAAPSGASGFNVYYLTAQGGIAQSMPTATVSSTQVQALTDHFSGYAVSWGRSDGGQNAR